MFLCVLPSARLYTIGALGEQVLIALHGDHRASYGPLSEEDVLALGQIVRGGAVNPGWALVRWLTEGRWAETVDTPASDLPPGWSSIASRQLSAYASFTGIEAARELHEKIKKSKVLVVGVGGIGCHVIQHLLRIGVSSFKLVDPDLVDDSNLNRQVLYTHQDIGARKCLAAASHIRAYGESAAQVTCIEEDFLSWHLDDHEIFDLAVISADSNPPAIQRHAARIFYPRKIPYGFASYRGTVGLVGPLVFDMSKGCGCCPQLMIPHFEDALHPVVGTGIPSVPPSSFATNAMLAAMFVDRWIHSLSARGSNGSLRLNLESLQVTTIDASCLSGCPVCGLTR